MVRSLLGGPEHGRFDRLRGPERTWRGPGTWDIAGAAGPMYPYPCGKGGWAVGDRRWTHEATGQSRVQPHRDPHLYRGHHDPGVDPDAGAVQGARGVAADRVRVEPAAVAHRIHDLRGRLQGRAGD